MCLCLVDRARTLISGGGHQEFTPLVNLVRASARLLRLEGIRMQKSCVDAPECVMALPMGNETAYSLAWVGHHL